MNQTSIHKLSTHVPTAEKFIHDAISTFDRYHFSLPDGEVTIVLFEVFMTDLENFKTPEAVQEAIDYCKYATPMITDANPRFVTDAEIINRILSWGHFNSEKLNSSGLVEVANPFNRNELAQGIFEAMIFMIWARLSDLINNDLLSV